MWIRHYNDKQALSWQKACQLTDYVDDCPPVSSRIEPMGTACGSLRSSRGWRTSGYLAFVFDGRDDNGVNLSFTSPLLRLSPSTTSVLPNEPPASFGPEEDEVTHDREGPKQ
jgi:hypothetical protein